jgi:hypothetical protein
MIDFQVRTTVHLPSTAISVNLVSITELVPVQYSFTLHDATYEITDGKGSVRSSGLVAELSSFHFTTTDCQLRSSSWNYYFDDDNNNGTSNLSTKGNQCEKTVFFQFNLNAEDRLVYYLHGQKNFLLMDSYPPDASRGIHLLPALITFGGNTSTAKEYHFSKDHLLSQSIPDLSMPYNVIALVRKLHFFLFLFYITIILFLHIFVLLGWYIVGFLNGKYYQQLVEEILEERGERQEKGQFRGKKLK